MPLLLEDDLALLVLRALMRLPPVSGHVIIGLLQTMQQKQDDQGKLIQTLMQKVDQMSQTQNQDSADFQTELAGIRDDVAKQTTAVNGMAVFVAGIKDKLAEALARPDPVQALAAVKAIHADLNSNTAAIVAASVENTTASTEPPAPVVPTTTVDPGSVGDASGDAEVG
jgi:hypothetical protein